MSYTLRLKNEPIFISHYQEYPDIFTDNSKKILKDLGFVYKERIVDIVCGICNSCLMNSEYYLLIKEEFTSDEELASVDIVIIDDGFKTVDTLKITRQFNSRSKEFENSVKSSDDIHDVKIERESIVSRRKAIEEELESLKAREMLIDDIEINML